MQNNELKKVRIKNRTCYYFDDIIKLEDFDKKSHTNISIYDTSYRALIVSKPLRIRFDKIDGIIRIYDRSKYLILFGTKKDDAIYDKIRYLLSTKKTSSRLFLTIFQKSKLILMTLCLYKKR